MEFSNKHKALWESASKAYKKSLNEGQNEDMAQKILDKAGKSDAFDSIIKVDPTQKNKYAPVIAQFFVDGTDLSALKYIFDKIPEIEKKAGISPQRTKKGIFWNKDNEKVGAKSGVPMDFIKFSESVDSIMSRIKGADALKNAGKQPTSIKNSDGTDPNLVFNKNGIKIFESYSQGACVKYSQGQDFCIGNASGGMYNTYRKSDSSSFHFVFDENSEYPLQTVVVDKAKNGFKLTDELNTTGTIQNPNGEIGDRGNYTNEYMSYLKSKGVDLAIFKDNPYTKEEADLNDLVNQSYSDLDFFYKILGKTKEMPNGDVVDLTLEWLIKNTNSLTALKWDMLNTIPDLKSKIRDYEWRLATSGGEIDGRVLNKFSQNNVEKYVLTHGRQGNSVETAILNSSSPEIQEKYWGDYIIYNGKNGHGVDSEYLKKASPEDQKKYWDESLKYTNYDTWDEYVASSIKNGQTVRPHELSMASPKVQKQYKKDMSINESLIKIIKEEIRKFF